MAILTALIPLLSMLLSVVILRDPLTLGMAAGGALSFLGLLYLVGQGEMLSVFQHGIHVGDGLMLLAAFSYALYGVLLRHWKAVSYTHLDVYKRQEGDTRGKGKTGIWRS